MPLRLIGVALGRVSSEEFGRNGAGGLEPDAGAVGKDRIIRLDMRTPLVSQSLRIFLEGLHLWRGMVADVALVFGPRRGPSLNRLGGCYVRQHIEDVNTFEGVCQGGAAYCLHQTYVTYAKLSAATTVRTTR